MATKKHLCFKNEEEFALVFTAFLDKNINTDFKKIRECDYEKLPDVFLADQRLLSKKHNAKLQYVFGLIVNMALSAYNMFDNVISATEIRSTFNLAGKMCRFPHKTVNFILEKYNTNNKFFDYSIGWGDRAIVSILNGIEYYGTDPSEENWPHYHDMLDYLQIDSENDTLYKLYKQGSEIFIPELENKIGLCFSSPPYFSLEPYEINNPNNSITKYPQYDAWKEFFLKQTIMNCERYLIDGGFFICNIKSFGKYDLEGDLVDIVEKNTNLKFVCTESMVQKAFFRPITQKEHEYLENQDILMKNTEEKIYVFKKGDKELPTINNKIKTLF